MSFEEASRWTLYQARLHMCEKKDLLDFSGVAKGLDDAEAAEARGRVIEDRKRQQWPLVS